MNAALGGGNYIAEQLIKGEKIDIGDAAISTVVGGISGAIGGKGANGKSLSQAYKSAAKGIERENRRKNIKYAVKQMARCKSWQKTIKSAFKVAFSKMAFCNFFSAFTSRKLIGIRKR